MPEFSYVHYIDVHGPWDGAPFIEAGAETRDDPGDLDEYRAAVRYVDRQAVELYEFFRARYGGELFFLFTSDHGRSFPGDVAAGGGRRLRRNKLSMHDFNLRVPLAILPGAGLAPRRVKDPVSLVDVAPTLLDWLGLESEVELAGQGLLPVIRGEARELPERPLYARNDAFGLWTDALLWRGRKYVRYFDLDDGEVFATRRFDLGSDPDERRGSAEPWGPAAALLEELSSHPGVRYEAAFVAPDADLKRALQALGYLEESAP